MFVYFNVSYTKCKKVDNQTLLLSGNRLKSLLLLSFYLYQNEMRIHDTYNLAVLIQVFK